MYSPKTVWLLVSELQFQLLWVKHQYDCSMSECVSVSLDVNWMTTLCMKICEYVCMSTLCKICLHVNWIVNGMSSVKLVG